MFQKINNKEKGAAATTIIITTLVVLGVLGGLGYAGYKAGFFGSLAEFTIKSVMGILMGISGMLFKMGGGLFEAIYNSAILSQPMTRGEGAIAQTVLHGWAIVRDFANVFIVLGFVVIGIATILRIREYEAQKKLLPLIIVALLINFSLLICGIIIDATNITMKYFTQISGPTGITQPYTNLLQTDEGMKKIEEAVGDIDTEQPKTVINYIMAYSSLALFGVISAMIFFTYGILFLFRYVALMCLIILSPLAFVCSVFPATKSVYEQWKKNFIQWAIIGIPAAFFVYLAGHLLVYLMASASSGVDLAGANLAFWIPTAFLLFSYSLIFQTSAIGASAALGLATGAMGYAMGASKWVGGKALRGAGAATGASRLGSAAKDTATSLGERIGLVRTGTTAANQRARLSEKGRENRINAMTAEEKVQELQRVRWGREGRLDRAKIVESLAKENKLDMIPAGQRGALISHAMQHGVRPKDLIGGMQSANIAEIINNNRHDTETRAEGFKALSKRRHLDLITIGNRGRAIDEAIQHGARPEEIEKADYHYGAHNMTRLERIAQTNFGGNFATRNAIDQATIRQQATEQTLDENLASMDHDQLRNIDVGHLTAQRVDRFTPDKINAFQRASQAHRDAIKSHFDPTDPTHRLLNDLNTAWAEYQAAAARGDQGAATNRYAEFRRLRTLYTTASSLP